MGYPEISGLGGTPASPPIAPPNGISGICISRSLFERLLKAHGTPVVEAGLSDVHHGSFLPSTKDSYPTRLAIFAPTGQQESTQQFLVEKNLHWRFSNIISAKNPVGSLSFLKNFSALMQQKPLNPGTFLYLDNKIKPVRTACITLQDSPTVFSNKFVPVHVDMGPYAPAKIEQLGPNGLLTGFKSFNTLLPELIAASRLIFPVFVAVVGTFLLYQLGQKIISKPDIA